MPFNFPVLSSDTPTEMHGSLNYHRKISSYIPLTDFAGSGAAFESSDMNDYLM